MNYFDFLPTIKYQFSSGEYTVVDIFNRIGVKPNFYSNDFFLYEQTLDNAKTPDRFCMETYGSYDDYWLLMLINNVYDVNRDWPVDQSQFNSLLNDTRTKKSYYVYETGPIEPNDILYANEFSYGVIESWNPFTRQIVIKENYNLPTTNLSDYTFKIRRVNKNGTVIEINNYCDESTTSFTLFGYKVFSESPMQILDSYGKNLNPFLKVTGGVVSDSELILDSCGENKTNFQTTLIYKVINGLTVNNIQIITKEQTLISEYVDKIKLYVISSDFINLISEKARNLLKNRSETANTLFRIG